MNQSSGMKEKVQRIEVEKIESPKSEQSLLYPNTAFNKINIRTSRTLIETLLWFCLFCACSGGISRLMPCSSSVKSHCKDCPLCIRKKKRGNTLSISVLLVSWSCVGVTPSMSGWSLTLHTTNTINLKLNLLITVQYRLDKGLNCHCPRPCNCVQPAVGQNSNQILNYHLDRYHTATRGRTSNM